jgi:coniferyl-aldehyde dehydrogenase
MSMLLSDTGTVCNPELKAQFDEMQLHFDAQPYLALSQRIRLLKSLKRELLALEAELVAASSKDFGFR